MTDDDRDEYLRASREADEARHETEAALARALAAEISARASRVRILSKGRGLDQMRGAEKRQVKRIEREIDVLIARRRAISKLIGDLCRITFPERVGLW